MIYLLLSILSSVAIFVLFRAFEKQQINNLYAIVSNYVVAAGLGFLLQPREFSVSEIWQANWLYQTIGIGFMFVAMFRIMALGAQKLGLTRVSVLVKLSVIIPVLAGLFIHQEKISNGAVMGIFIGLVAVILASINSHKEKLIEKKWLWFLPIILFIGPGAIDMFMKMAQQNWLATNEKAFFSAVLFAFAFLWGLLFAVHERFVRKHKIKWRDILWGAILGIPNFGSIYFILLALDKSNWPSAIVFPINNVAIVAICSLLGVFLFREKLSRLNVIGLLCGIISIVIIAYA